MKLGSEVVGELQWARCAGERNIDREVPTIWQNVLPDSLGDKRRIE